MRRIVLLLALLLSPVVAAQVNVPTPLEPWRGWAQDGEEFRNCALVAGHEGQAAEDFFCAWPGVLQIEADAGGARFAMSWQVQAESWVPLPGNAENWPQDVRINGQGVPGLFRHGCGTRSMDRARRSYRGRAGSGRLYSGAWTQVAAGFPFLHTRKKEAIPIASGRSPPGPDRRAAGQPALRS